ncbi:hypothetical protein L873DRAFT_1842637 [Choiromyces venosus 120613-1]|uniref:Uncharacterized protein n=1 Tax=Choiromyces venosus 120613-1 TaxID=1336337 RepID=A0A3N4JVX2_9PEZI|nr:hypothetical protein L873DRAFT_1842637 [Choiromyces venosus 120613-1]
MTSMHQNESFTEFALQSTQCESIEQLVQAYVHKNFDSAARFRSFQVPLDTQDLAQLSEHQSKQLEKLLLEMKLSTVLQLLDPFSNPTAMRMTEDHELAERMIAAIKDNTRAIDEPNTRAYPEGLLKLEPEQIMEIAYQLVDAINNISPKSDESMSAGGAIPIPPRTIKSEKVPGHSFSSPRGVMSRGATVS